MSDNTVPTVEVKCENCGKHSVYALEALDRETSFVGYLGGGTWAFLSLCDCGALSTGEIHTESYKAQLGSVDLEEEQ